MLGLAVFGLSSCGWEDPDVPMIRASQTYTAVLMKRSELEKSVKAMEPRALKNPGKIYHYQSYILISEKYEGVHIIDNSDLTKPQAIKFIAVPGCVDMAVKGNVLYVDNAVDLVSISIADLNDIKEIHRVKNVFPEITPPDMLEIPTEFTSANRPENTVIIAWREQMP